MSGAEEQDDDATTKPADARLPRLPAVTKIASPPVSWLELFYDLVMVAAIIVFSDALVHDETWQNLVWLTVMFGMVWWVWLSTTLAVNLDRREDNWLAALIVGQMFGVTLLTIVAGNSVEPRSELVAVVYCFLMLLVAGVYENVARRSEEIQGFCRRRRNAFALSGLLWLLGAATTSPIHSAAWIAAAMAMVAPMFTSVLDRSQLLPRGDDHHLRERMALLTIIVFGESFVKVSLNASHSSLESVNYVVIALQFVILFAAFDAYFRDIPRAEIPLTARLRRWWFGIHLILHIAIIGLAVGLAKFAVQKDNVALTEADNGTFTAALALNYVALAGLDAIVHRPPQRRLIASRVLTGLAFVVAGAAAWNLAPDLQVGALIFGAVGVAAIVLSRAALADEGSPAGTIDAA